MRERKEGTPSDLRSLIFAIPPSDGLIVVSSSPVDDFANVAMRMINADGCDFSLSLSLSLSLSHSSLTPFMFRRSVSEMCGNGLRCVAALAAEENGVVIVETDAGLRTVRVLSGGCQGVEVAVKAGMGKAIIVNPKVSRS